MRPGQRGVKQVIAEMGGKNPIIVDSDADLDVAVPAIVKSAFGYAGQKCSAASRVLAVESVFDQVIERLSGAIELLTIDHPSSPATDLGPLIDEDTFKRVRIATASWRKARAGSSSCVTTCPTTVGTSVPCWPSSTIPTPVSRPRRSLVRC